MVHIVDKMTPSFSSALVLVILFFDQLVSGDHPSNLSTPTTNSTPATSTTTIPYVQVSTAREQSITLAKVESAPTQFTWNLSTTIRREQNKAILYLLVVNLNFVSHSLVSILAYHLNKLDCFVDNN